MEPMTGMMNKKFWRGGRVMTADQTETRAYRGPCGGAYATRCDDGTWYVHYEDKGRGYGRKMGCGLTSDEASRLGLPSRVGIRSRNLAGGVVMKFRAAADQDDSMTSPTTTAHHKEYLR